jgi:glucokinase
MNIFEDKRVVLTIDAGGTNFVFSAMKGGKEICDQIRKPSNGHDLESCLGGMIKGFNEVITKKDDQPTAISFAFPGPADYPKGIIGDLNNLPCFRGGIAPGPMLETKFSMPVFINNDGNLYAYGEALGGFLPKINSILSEAGSKKQYKSLLGLTLGTGFGAGYVNDGVLMVGDNSLGAEAWLLSNRFYPEANAEESVSIRAVRRFYADEMGIPLSESPSPKEIALEGDPKAAKAAYARLGQVMGDSLSNMITLYDCPVVIGGGVSKAKDLIMPSLMKELNSKFTSFSGDSYPRLVQKVYDVENDVDKHEFTKGDATEIDIPIVGGTIAYDPKPRVCLGFSQIGTSEAITLGAYAFALNELDSIR